MENIAYYNGKISSIEEMTIPMNERSSYFGDGVYDAMFTVDHVPLQLDDHLRRFYRSAKKIDIDIPMPFEELRAMVLDFCRRIDSPDAMAYVQATRGVGMRGHAYRFAGGTPSLWVWVKPDMLDPMDRSYKAITMEDTRYFHCDIKTINLLPAVIYTQRAEEAGCDETILHRGDRVTECAHSNVHILKDGALKTALRQPDSAGHHPRAPHRPVQGDGHPGDRRAVHRAGDDGGGRGLLHQRERAVLPH